MERATVHHFGFRLTNATVPPHKAKFNVCGIRVYRLPNHHPGGILAQWKIPFVFRCLDKDTTREYGGAPLADLCGSRHIGRPVVQLIFLPERTVLVRCTSVVSDTKGDAHAPVSMDALGAPSPKAVDSALRAVRAKQQNFAAGAAILKEMHISVQ